MKKIKKIIITACLCLLVIFCSSGFAVLNLEEEDELSGMPCDNQKQFQEWLKTYEEPIVETKVPQLNYLGAYRITFYDDCPQCVGKWAYMGLTASGASCQANHTCACGSDIPFGTVIYIEGLGTYICEDRGVPSGCIDIYVNYHGEIPLWGVGYFNCYIIN